MTFSDASRFFYGSLNCDLLLPSNRLPLTLLRHYYNAWKQTQPRMAQAAAPAERKAETSSLFERLLTEMAMAREGTRNHTLNRVAFLAGKLVAEGGITDTDAESRLTQAALQSGLPDSEATKTIKRAIGQGKAAH